MMKVTVKFFAIARDLTGTEKTILTFPTSLPAFSVLEQLLVKYPQLKEWENHLRVAVNCEYVSLEHVLHDGDEVAVIPPVSGG
jgi:molybdopterin converting factor subunit 1